MSHKIKKPKIIFLTVLVLCLAILTGGVVYAWNGGRIDKSTSKSPTSLSKSLKKPTSISASRVKIKKTSDPNILSWKNEIECKNGSSFNEYIEFSAKKKNVPKLFSESGFEKGTWIDNWEQELKDNCWLVIEKHQELDQTFYSRWYEKDQGEKLKEMGSSKWW